MSRIRSAPFWVVPMAWITFSFSSAIAWNESGHRQIGIIAYELSNKTTRTWVVQLLADHPRFKKDFKQTARSGGQVDEDEKAKWLFSQAAIWPDKARSFKGTDRTKYHHGPWHYINEPIFLSEDDQQALQGTLTTNLSRDPQDATDPNDMNIIQALNDMNDILSSNASKAEKAVALCWLFHLVGDLHQPLHSTAFFSQARFTKGDQGGNEILIESGGKNLHARWDSFLGSGKAMAQLSKKVEDYLDDGDLSSLGKKAAKGLDWEDWLNESYDLAYDYVYDDNVVSTVADGEEHSMQSLAKVDLGEDYMENGKAVSVEQAVKAGYRLAALLKKLAK